MKWNTWYLLDNYVYNSLKKYLVVDNEKCARLDTTIYFKY